MKATHDVYLGLGGNIGNPQAAIHSVLSMLDRRGDTEVVAVSSLYRTPPWGKVDQPDFLNAAAHIRTDLEPHALLAACLDMERSLKRVRDERWGPRSIDIDILLYDDRMVNEEGLAIPHPRMTQRAFVLEPLAELAPQRLVEGRSIASWLETVDRAGLERVARPQDWWK